MKKQLKINMEFCDEWIKGLVKDILALEFECQENNEDYDYIVCDSSYLFRPFSEVVKKIKKDVVAIFMTGEAVAPDFNLFDYAVVFDEILFNDRCVDIKCFGDTFKDVLVKGIDVKETLKNKSGFCNFIYSNPLAHPNRDAFFHKLNEYKKVDSYGKHLNNMNCDDTRGDANWNGLLVDMKSKYKFSIAFENASHLGYTTEKIVTSMRANSLPIYWGNSDVVKCFNPKSFINCHDYADFDEVVKKIIELDNDDAKWQEMMNEPWMTEKQVQDYQEKVSKVKEQFSNIFRQDKVDAMRRASGTWNDLYRDILGRKSQPKKNKKSYKLFGLSIMKIRKWISLKY